MITNYNQYINEKLTIQNEYGEGDLVLIRYYLTGDVTAVKIIEKKSRTYYIVSHNVDGGFIKNAPDMGIRATQILGFAKPPQPFDMQATDPTKQTTVVKSINQTSNDLYL